MYRVVCFLVLFFAFSCKNISNNQGSGVVFNKTNYNIGETLKLNTNKKEEIIHSVEVYSENNNLVRRYTQQDIDASTFIIRRFLDNESLSLSKTVNVIVNTNYYSYSLDLNVLPSISIVSICAIENCNTVSGNVIETLDNKLSIKTYHTGFNKIQYKITAFDRTIEDVVNSYESLTDVDTFIFKMPEVTAGVSSYTAILQIKAFKDNNEVAETVLPFRVVRPLEVKHYGKYELAEVYEPVPVTGCIPGTIGNNVSYSESVSETRQNSVSLSLSKSWSNSNSQNIDTTRAEGLTVAETENTQLTSSMSESETVSESETQNSNNTESNNFSFSTSDGESWSWSFDEGNSNTSGTQNSNSTNAGVNGSVTLGATTEGSIPLLGKASGKVETTAGASMNWLNTETNSNSSTETSNRGYMTAGSSQTGNQYGSVQTLTQGHTLSGSFAYTSQNSSSVSQGSSTYSGRVWNMSESISNGNVITEGDTKSIDETIVDSSSSTTTFSYSGYIPRGKVGIFYRQTSRYTKLSEIITYDVNGFPHHAGYVSMNTWAWAPELVIGTSCSDIPETVFSGAECYIPPCGE